MFDFERFLWHEACLPSKKVCGAIVLCKTCSVLCVLEQLRVDNFSSGYNWLKTGAVCPFIF
jgi:hypothetical protein